MTGGVVFPDDLAQRQPCPPPANLPDGAWALCGDCGDRQPVQRWTEWYGSVPFHRERAQADRRCVGCPTRRLDEPKQYPTHDTSTTTRPRRRWLPWQKKDTT